MTEGAYHNSSLPVEQRVADLLNRMTLEEKTAQMSIFHILMNVLLLMRR